MPPLNPNLLLIVVLAVILAAMALLVEIFYLGGDPGVIGTRTGLVLGFTASMVTGLLALFNSTRTNGKVYGVEGKVENHNEELEAARSRIAFLEGRLGVKTPIEDKTTIREAN